MFEVANPSKRLLWVLCLFLASVFHMKSVLLRIPTTVGALQKSVSYLPFALSLFCFMLPPSYLSVSSLACK